MPPDFDTNMKFKFSILALLLQVIVIILFGIFVDYDPNPSKTLYPRKYFYLSSIEPEMSLNRSLARFLNNFWDLLIKLEKKVVFWGKNIFLRCESSRLQRQIQIEQIQNSASTSLQRSLLFWERRTWEIVLVFAQQVKTQRTVYCFERVQHFPETSGGVSCQTFYHYKCIK